MFTHLWERSRATMKNAETSGDLRADEPDLGPVPVVIENDLVRREVVIRLPPRKRSIKLDAGGVGYLIDCLRDCAREWM
jgi:hypothetical protein